MHRILMVRNQHLLRDVLRLKEEVAGAEVPEELLGFVARMQSAFDGLHRQIEQNLKDLDLREDAIIEDILSNTKQVTQFLRIISSRMVMPILRSADWDRLSLRFVAWLHQEHPSTRIYPPAVANGDCSVWPFTELCPIYFFPAAEQREILYQPLFFHEFGHLLYRCHKQELDDLVQELQKDIEAVLTPYSYRGDRHSSRQRLQRDAIVRTWYQWTQELFCDAVGLTIGGPSFLWALSTYLGTLDRGDFYRPPQDLQWSTHPVTWLRIKLLLSQAQAKGLSDEANAIGEEWARIAGAMGVVEDYHGFYDEALEGPIIRMLEDALTEVCPREYLVSDLEDNTGLPSPNCSPVSLAHMAWRAFFLDDIDYPAWENQAIRAWLN